MVQQRSNSKKKVIIENAVKTFYDLGVKDATMRKIAEASGISHPAIFNHFKSKYELAGILLNRYFDKIVYLTRDFLNNTKFEKPYAHYGVLYLWSIHYKLISNDKKFARFFYEFYIDAPEDFTFTIVESILMHFNDIFGLKYNTDKIYAFLDQKTTSDIDNTLVGLLLHDAISVNEAVKYLLNIFSVITDFSVTNEQIDEFSEKYISNELLCKYDIYNDFLCIH